MAETRALPPTGVPSPSPNDSGAGPVPRASYRLTLQAVSASTVLGGAATSGRRTGLPPRRYSGRRRPVFAFGLFDVAERAIAEIGFARGLDALGLRALFLEAARSCTTPGGQRRRGPLRLGLVSAVVGDRLVDLREVDVQLNECLQLGHVQHPDRGVDHRRVTWSPGCPGANSRGRSVRLGRRRKAREGRGRAPTPPGGSARNRLPSPMPAKNCRICT